MKNGNIPTYDIYLAAYLALNGISPQYVKHDTRVVFEFPMDSQTCDLMEAYNRNPHIELLPYVAALRRTRAQMLAQR